MKKRLFFNYLVGLSLALIEMAWELYMGVARENGILFQSTASILNFIMISLTIYSSFIIIIAYISMFLTLIIKKLFLRKIAPIKLNMALTASIFIALFLGTDMCYSKLPIYISLSQLISYGLLLFFASLLISVAILYYVFFHVSRVSRPKINMIPISFFSILFLIIMTICFTREKKIVIADKNKNNIVFISVDTLRQDRLGCYGYERSTSPNIDRIAQQGAIFFNSFAQHHTTLPSYMSMMTSLTPLIHNVDGFNSVLDRNRSTLAHLLQSQGYSCIAFVDGKRKSYIGGFHGFSRGFDWYGHYPENTTVFGKILPVRFILGLKIIFNKYFPEHGKGITDNVISWLRANKRHPFFLFVHYYSVHSQPAGLPYWKYPPFDEKLTDLPVIPDHFVVDGATGSLFLQKIQRHPRREKFVKEDLPVLDQLYDCGVAYVDDQIGRLYKELKNLNLLNSTAIIINSDHGEEFMEHDKLLHTQDYEECLRVPLIISLPRYRSHQRRIYSNVQGIDLAPTLLNIAGINAHSEMMGTSLMKELRGEKLPERAIISTSGNAMHYKDYSLLIKEHRVELYDLNNDPEQKNDLSKINPTLLSHIMTIYKETIKEHKTIKSNLTWEGKKEEIRLLPQDIEHLKSLGYVDE